MLCSATPVVTSRQAIIQAIEEFARLGRTQFSLSRARGAHVLVGQRPGTSPRLGESLNAEGSLELFEQFPAHGQYVHGKNHLVLFLGWHALEFDLTVDDAPRTFHDLLGCPAPVAAIEQ